MVAEKKKTEEKPEGEASDDDAGDSGLVICAIVTIVILMVLAVFDSMTTHYFKRGCIALAAWTMNNAPFSFVVFELVIIVLIVLCLPYGPLSLLSGALFYQKYGKGGIVAAWIALFAVTFVAFSICFGLGRYYLRETVEKQVNKKPSLSFLKNLDKLIRNGQGIEMVALLRVAPLPKGPTNYFLGTTSCTWRDFIIASIIVGLPECLFDVMIGAGAKNVNHDSPVSIAIFVILAGSFMGLMCYVGARAKAKLEALNEEEAQGGAKDELEGMTDGV